MQTAQLPTVRLLPQLIAADTEVCFRMCKLVGSGARRVGVRLLLLTCMGVFASTGVAAAHVCQPPPLVNPFAQWRDTSGYFLAPGGSFDGAAAGWVLNGAELSNGSGAGFSFGSISASGSLTIGAGGSAISPSLCVNSTMPYIRFFARQVSRGSDLLVQGVQPAGDGPAVPVTVTELPDGSMPSWGPADPIAVITASLAPGESVNGDLRFSVPGATGAWQIDDIYVDPYRGS